MKGNRETTKDTQQSGLCLCVSFDITQSFFALSQELIPKMRLWASQLLSVRHSAYRQFGSQLHSQ
jgi:hypothetical protein